MRRHGRALARRWRTRVHAQTLLVDDRAASVDRRHTVAARTQEEHNLARGAFDQHAICGHGPVALVRQAGYVLAVTTHAGSVQDARAPLELHRYEVLDSTGVAGLASLLGS